MILIAPERAGAFDRGFQYYRHDALESLEVKHKDSGSIVLNSQVYGNNLYTQTTTILIKTKFVIFKLLNPDKLNIFTIVTMFTKQTINHMFVVCLNWIFIFPQYSYYKTNIHGKLGYRILLEMIKTNRCFYRDSEQPLQFTKSQITLNPA
jgi:hypothetical protein